MEDEHIRAAVLAAVLKRGAGKTLCPSEVARALSADWRDLMPDIRRVANDLASAGQVAVTQKSKPVNALTARGPVRLGLPDPQDPD